MTLNRKNLFHTPRNAAARAGLLTATLMGLTALASPPSITFTQVSSGYAYQGTESRDDLAAVITGSTGLSSGPLSSAALFATDGGNGGEGYHLDVNFSVVSCTAGSWSFQLGPDFGRGGALFVDGVKLDDATEDLWWNFNWSNSSQLLSGTVNLAAGTHRVEAFGFEDCCWGSMSMQFQVSNTGWQDVSIANLTPPDEDGDGFADCDDACPSSDLSATVVIGGCNSGVANTLLAGGCTIADEIAHCAASAVNHGAFVSCVAHLTDALKAQGIITGAQKGAIQRCAAQSSIGK